MYGFLILCVLLYFPLILSRKLASKGTEDKKVLFKFSLFVAAMGMAVSFIVVLIQGACLSFDLSTIFTALLFGVTLAASQIATFYALRTTSVAIVNMSATAGILIPCVFGIIFFHEPATAGNIIGIVAFLLAAYLITRQPNKEKLPFTAKGLIACLILFLVDGFGSVAMQLFSRYSKNVNDSVFMLYGYLFNTLIMLVCVCMLIKRSKLEKSETVVFPKKLFLFGALIAGVAFAIQQINVVLADQIDAAILFPVLKSGSLIFGAVVGWAIFKEKLSVKNIVGLVLCIGAVAVLNL